MLKNYFRTTFRVFQKNKTNSFINIFGLAIGLACSILIMLWVKDEVSYNGYHENLDNLYRVMEDQRYSDGSLFTFSATPGPMAPEIKKDYEEIIYASRMTWNEMILLENEGESFFERSRYVDPDFLRMFSHPMVEGDIETALDNPNSIVITQKLAEKYFGHESALGQILKMNDDKTMKVTGVIENVPANSTMNFDALIPAEDYIKDNTWANQWGNNNLRTFVQLARGTDYEITSTKIKDYVKEHNEGSNVELFLQPVREMHLYSDFREGKRGGGRIIYVRIFSLVAIFILVIACINFMNLATAQSTKRAKEVGMRKVIGAQKPHLILQYLGESTLYALLAMVFALLAVYFIIPFFNALTEKEMTLILNTRNILVLLGITIITGILAGSYPALYISNFQPVLVLKGKISSGKEAALFRQVLVVTQFALSIVLIIGTIVVYKQLNFVMNQNIGLEKENIVYVPIRGEMGKNYSSIYNQINRLPGVHSVTVTSMSPIQVGNSTSSVEWDGKNPDDEILFSNFFVDFDFAKTFKINIVEGRDFDRELVTDSANFLVNEETARKMGFEPGNRANQPITFWGDLEGVIVGIMEDFHFQSVHQKIEPLIVLIGDVDYSYLHMRIDLDGLDQTLEKVKEIHNTYAAAYPFEYHFLDEDWEELYQSEKMVGKLFNYFAGLAILISCLGLFGLATYAAERRVKEIGVRKALGASALNIATLMNRDFALLVLISSVIGCPLAYFVMDKWLDDFAYHINVGWITLVMGALIALFIALITISYKAFSAALVSPSKSLRYE